MNGPGRRPHRHTIEEWLAQPEERRLELIDGYLLEKAFSDEPHAGAQAALIAEL